MWWLTGYGLAFGKKSDGLSFTECDLEEDPEKACVDIFIWGVN